MSNQGIFDVNSIVDLKHHDQWSTLGQLELIETQTVSSVSTVDFTNLGNYNVHFLTINNTKVVNDNVWFQVRFYENGVLETANAYQFANIVGTATGTFYYARSTANSKLQFMTGANIGNATNESGNAYCYFYNLTDSSKYSFMTHQCVVTSPSTNTNINFGSGTMSQKSAVDGIQLFLASGDIQSADISLYGIRY